MFLSNKELVLIFKRAFDENASEVLLSLEKNIDFYIYELNSKQDITSLIESIKFLSILLTIENLNLSNKKIKNNELKKTIITFFHKTKYQELKNSIIKVFKINESANTIKKIDKINQEFMVSKDFRFIYFKNCESIFCNLLKLSSKQTCKEIIKNKNLFHKKQYRFYFLKTDFNDESYVITQNGLSIKYFNIKKETLEWLLKEKNPYFWNIEKSSFLTWEHVICALENKISKKHVDENKNKYGIDLLAEIINKKIEPNLISKAQVSFDLFNYAEECSQKNDWFEKKIKENSWLFRVIKNPTLEMSLFALKAEEYSLKLENLKLLNNDSKDIQYSLYKCIKTVPNSTHEETVQNLESKIEMIKLITS